ncbi:MAG: hypothetical protein ABI240_07825 [Sphingomonas sp.]
MENAMPVSKGHTTVSNAEIRDFALLDLLTTLERVQATADDLGLSTVGIRLDQAILALMRERALGFEAQGLPRALANRH